MHFAPEMWERRIDNKKKLKPNAVPTIFGCFIKEKVFREPTEKYFGNLFEKEHKLVHDIQEDEDKNQDKVSTG